MSRELLSGIQLPPEIARFGIGLVNMFDPSLQSSMAKIIDELPFSPDTAYQLALQYASHAPNLIDFVALLKAHEKKTYPRRTLSTGRKPAESTSKT